MKRTEILDPSADSIILQATRIAAAIRSCVDWARNERRRLVHLTLHSKKHRTRKKNAARIVREYMKGVNK